MSEDSAATTMRLITNVEGSPASSALQPPPSERSLEELYATPPLDMDEPCSSAASALVGSHATKRKPPAFPLPPPVPDKRPALDPQAPHASSSPLHQHQHHSDEELEEGGSFSAQWLSSFHSLPPTQRMRALTSLVQNCSLAEIRHLQKVIEPHLQKDFIAALPKELALIVLAQLRPKDLARAAGVSRYWRRLTEDHLLWREQCVEAGLSFADFSAQSEEEAAPPGSCQARSKWKALFLRHSRVNANWRRGAVESGGKLLRGHDDHVITCLQIAGDRILSGSDDNTLKLWCARSGEMLTTLSGHTGGVWSSQMTEDARVVVSGSTDRTVRVWEAETGNCVHTLTGHTSTVRCMALEGGVVVSGSRDTSLKVWDVAEGRQTGNLTGHVAAVRCVQLAGNRVVSGAYDYQVKVWDIRSQAATHTLTGHTNRVYSLQLDPTRNLAISGSLDTSIRVWDLRTGNCLHTLMGHQSLTSGMQLRGRILVSGNADSTVKVWDIVDGQCLHTLSGPNRHTSAVTSLQFLANGLVVTSSDDGTVKLWDTANGTFVRDVVELPSRDSGGCIWRLKATTTALVAAAGSRTGTEDTKLILLDFDAPFP